MRTVSLIQLIKNKTLSSRRAVKWASCSWNLRLTVTSYNTLSLTT